jgi:hypothetical protein
MVTRRRHARRAVIVTAALVAALGMAGPASAVGGNGDTNTGGGGTGSGGASSGGASSGTSWGSGTSTPSESAPEPAKTGTVKSCHIVSSSSYLGASCGSLSGGGNTKSIKQILDGSKLPDCWNEPMSPAELDAMNLQNTPGEQGSKWYWHKCLKGIHPKSFEIVPGGIEFTVGVDSFRNQPGKTDPKPEFLDANQRELVEMHATDGQIPYPVAGVSPSARPRVNQDVAFFDGTADEVTVRAVGVLLRARIEKLTIQPMGEGEGSISCPGSGVEVDKDDTPASKPNACWYRYQKSSAGQPDSMFQVPITAHWQVSTSTDGGATWAPFNEFTKTSTTTVRVNEIQAIVVH